MINVVHLKFFSSSSPCPAGIGSVFWFYLNMIFLNTRKLSPHYLDMCVFLNTWMDIQPCMHNYGLICGL